MMYVRGSLILIFVGTFYQEVLGPIKIEYITCLSKNNVIKKLKKISFNSLSKITIF